MYATYFVPSLNLPLQLISTPLMVGLLIVFSLYLNRTVFKPIKQFVEINDRLSK